MSLLDKVKGTLGFDDGDWEEEYDGTFDHENDSNLVVRKRADRDWDERDEYEEERLDRDEYDEDRYEEADEFEDSREDEPYEDEGRSYERGNVRLTSRPGYAGYSPGDKPADFEAVAASTNGAAAPRRSSVPHRSRGVVTGREVTTGMSQHRAATDSTLHVSSPRSFADAEIIGNHFKSGHPVVLDVSLVTKAVAQRILDFSFGLTYGREGSIDKINDKAFLLMPRGGALSVSDRQRLVELGYVENRTTREVDPDVSRAGGARESF